MVSQQLFKPLFLVGIMVWLVVGLALTTVVAQDEQSGSGLRITPVREELILANGQSDTYEIEITNVSQREIDIVTIINDFESDDETGQPRLLTREDESSAFSLRSFVTLPEPFTLGPEESRNVQIQVAIPSDLAPGGYYGAVRFAPGSFAEGDTEGNLAVSLNASVASLLLISVPGEAQEGMELNFIEARKDGSGGRFFETAPNSVAISLENTGNSILKPFGNVSIKNMFGNEVFTYEMNSAGQTRANVLPKSSRVFDDQVTNLGRIGKYTVETNLSYGEGGGNIITATGSFWIIPWRIILAIIVVVSFIAWASTSGIKMYNRRVVERAKKKS